MCFSHYAFQVPKKSSTPLSRLVTFKTNSNLSKRIEAKVADGDVQGAFRLLASTDDIAPQNAGTLEELR